VATRLTSPRAKLAALTPRERAGIGAIIGGAAGAAAAYLLVEGRHNDTEPQTSAAFLRLLLVPVGAALGALIAVKWPSE
jgi:hypothetical protein